MSQKIQGLYTAVITPFNNKGEIDWNSFERIIENQIAAGVDGILFAGTTGESPTISNEETEELFEWGAEIINNKCKLIVGTGTNNTSACIAKSKIAEKIGADAQLVVNPYYNKPTQKGLYEHFTAIANATDVPVVMYNIEGRTGVNIETPTLLRLAEHPNIVAVKEASGSINQMMDVIRRVRPDFSVLVGDDAMTLPFMAAGGDGLFSVISNVIPNSMSALIKTCLEGDIAKARTMFYELLDLMKLSFAETNPIPVKEMMAAVGWCEPVFRLPMCNAEFSTLESIKGQVDFIKRIENL